MPKKQKHAKKCNLVRNFKHMTTVFNSNNFKTVIYTIQCFVPSFMPNKPSLNYFKRVSAKKVLKGKKRKYGRNFKDITIVFNSNHYKIIIYTK